MGKRPTCSTAQGVCQRDGRLRLGRCVTLRFVQSLFFFFVHRGPPHSVQPGYLGMERTDSGGGVCATLAEEDGETVGLFVIRPNARPIRYLLIGELKVREIVMRSQLFAVFGFA